MFEPRGDSETHPAPVSVRVPLSANAFARSKVLDHAFRALLSDGRLVVLDRGPRSYHGQSREIQMQQYQIAASACLTDSNPIPGHKKRWVTVSSRISSVLRLDAWRCCAFLNRAVSGTGSTETGWRLGCEGRMGDRPLVRPAILDENPLPDVINFAGVRADQLLLD